MYTVENPDLTLNDVVFLHLGLVVIVQTIHCLFLHVFTLVALSINSHPCLLPFLFCYLLNTAGECFVYLIIIR